MARLARGDTNMPDFNGFPNHMQVSQVNLEAATYKLLQTEPSTLASRSLNPRIPVQRNGTKLNLPQDVTGRRLFLLEKAMGKNNVWSDLDPKEKARSS